MEVYRSGVCEWFNARRGYGFITPDDGGVNVFVHQSVIDMPGFRSLIQGEKVEFYSDKTEKGIVATLVCGPNGEPINANSRQRPKHRIKCFNCYEYGYHLGKDCPRGVLLKTCFNCKSPDHFIKDCPEQLGKRCKPIA